MQRRACLPLAGAVFAVLLCAVGLEGEAQAQFGPPTVANVNPNTGPMQGGTSVTITGTNFSDVTAVRFGSNAAGSFTVATATQLTATPPPHPFPTRPPSVGVCRLLVPFLPCADAEPSAKVKRRRSLARRPSPTSIQIPVRRRGAAV